MGRPLTDRWIGTDTSDTVLYPLVRLSGRVNRAFILRQIGSDKFIVQCADNGEIGQARLTNTDDLAQDGLMCLRFSGPASGFVSRISNNRLKDWHGNQFDWSILSANGATVYVYDNSTECHAST